MPGLVFLTDAQDTDDTVANCRVHGVLETAPTYEKAVEIVREHLVEVHPEISQG